MLKNIFDKFFRTKNDRRGYSMSRNGTFYLNPSVAGKISKKYFKTRTWNPVKRRKISL